MQMDYLLDFNVILPEKKIINIFSELVNAFYNLIDENNRSNEELVKTRDTLLSKLISGELEINEINN
jgi:type I restriction enzyme S subunit